MTITCDVLVVGGGAAGVAAAAAAGRAGARVVLAERYGFLGGLATAAQVGTVCGLYLRDTTAAAPTPVAEGFPLEFAGRLQSASASQPLRVDRGLWILPYAPPDFARVADEIIGETKSITLMLHTTVADVRVEAKRIRQVGALAWNERVALQPAVVVDCTGEATAAALGGAAAEQGGTDQSPALVFVLENVAAGAVAGGLLELRRELRRAVERGELPALCERISLVPGSDRPSACVLKLGLLPADPELAGWQQITRWEREARGWLAPLVNVLTEQVAGFRNARLAAVAPQLGVRSGRRIVGRRRLTDAEVLAARKDPAAVARGAWPMERWGAGPRPEMTYFAERDFYDVPLDCLRPAELDNVWVAGRCLAAEAGAMTSARVIGTALATGWAAGTAAVQTTKA